MAVPSVRVRDFKGLRSNQAPNLIDPAESPYLLNACVINGWLSPTPGFTRVDATPVTAADKDIIYVYIGPNQYRRSGTTVQTGAGGALSALGTPATPTVTTAAQIRQNFSTTDTCDSSNAATAHDPTLTEEGTYGFFQTYYVPSKEVESSPSSLTLTTITHTCSLITGNYGWNYDRVNLTTAAPNTDWGADTVVNVYGGGSRGFGFYGTFTGSTTVQMTKIPVSVGKLPEVFAPINAPAADATIFVYNESLFVVQNDQIYWSCFTTNNASILSYSENYRIDVDVSEDDGTDVLEGGIGTSRFAIVYSKRKIFGLTGNNWRQYKNNFFILSREAGGVNEFAITSDRAGNVYIFGGDQGITRITPNFEISNIADSIMDILLGSNVDVDLDTTRYDSMRTLYDPIRDWVWFFTSKQGSTANDIAIIWDIRREQWYVKDNIPGRAAWRETDTDGQTTLWTIDGSGYEYNISEAAYLDYSMSGTNTGNPTSAVGSGASTMTDTGAAFTTTGQGLTNAYVFLVEGGGATSAPTIVRRTISSNTATVLTISGTWGTAFTTGATYYVGWQDFTWYSKWYDAEEVDMKDVLHQMAIAYAVASSSQNLIIDLYIDFSSTSIYTSVINLNRSNLAQILPQRQKMSFFRIRLRSITSTNNPQIREISFPVQSRGRTL